MKEDGANLREIKMKKKNKKRKIGILDYVKANRKGSREAELEVSIGWAAKTKVHKNKKKYDRKDRDWKE